ncbi:hypothetical protein X797_005478 [Metarhizium robertsii]|uniref:Uncharacterized protein n=1 Tax=Metarhizium robertsii TaxID=568076 RepID=A0A014N577_9HYPO|nr:hypothetical protein X797_005478 [Metarhizium robertsii]
MARRQQSLVDVDMSEDIDKVFESDEPRGDSDTDVSSVEDVETLTIQLLGGTVHPPEYYQRGLEEFIEGKFDSEDYKEGTEVLLNALEEQWHVYETCDPFFAHPVDWWSPLVGSMPSSSAPKKFRRLVEGVGPGIILSRKIWSRAIDVLHAMRRQVKLLVVSGFIDALMSCRVLDAKAAADLQSEHGLQQVLSKTKVEEEDTISLGRKRLPHKSIRNFKSDAWYNSDAIKFAIEAGDRLPFVRLGPRVSTHTETGAPIARPFRCWKKNIDRLRQQSPTPLVHLCALHINTNHLR